MDAVVLANILRWSLQVALLTLVGAAILRLLAIDAPAVRHTFWRALLLLCLALPLAQPWDVPAAAGGHSGIDLVAPPFQPSSSAGSGPAGRSLVATALHALEANWVWLIGFVLAVGAAARLAWLALGFFRLRRLRRLGEQTPTCGDYDELAALIDAGAEIRRVPGLRQPVTFGLFKPVVLLPDSFSTLSGPLQRAVLAHELWHVRRRDWAWVLVEEVIRGAFWFNPAIWWLISRIQSSREEVVDELAVQLTNARRAYLEALLAFADEPTVFPATPFARRRHLFHRMLLISREAAMSSRKIVTRALIAFAVVLAAGWFGASAFPLEARPQMRDAAVSQAAASGQNPPRDRRPGEAGPASAQEIELKKAIQSDSSRRDLYFQLARLQEERGARDEAESTWNALRQAFPSDRTALMMVAGAHNRSGRFEQAVQALEEVAALDPTNPESHQIIATFYWEKASKDKSLSPAETQSYIKAGISATDKALSYNPEYTDALTYKNILLRMQANLEPDAAVRQALLTEANILRSRAMELNKKARSSGGAPGRVQMEFSPAPPPPPPPPPPSDAQGELVDGVAPVRVGGNMRPPVKVRDVRPVYPADARDAKVQGVVIIEATIDTLGNVERTRVLRAVPTLERAAIEAVEQWKFQPTLMNGVPVPVIMTVTVNFTLQ